MGYIIAKEEEDDICPLCWRTEKVGSPWVDVPSGTVKVMFFNGDDATRPANRRSRAYLVISKKKKKKKKFFGSRVFESGHTRWNGRKLFNTSP
jgi:hypothetical protein